MAVYLCDRNWSFEMVPEVSDTQVR